MDKVSFTEEQILEHYRTEADKHGMEGSSTIQDVRTRKLEMEAIFSYILQTQELR